jgi:hypothetical protein
LVTSGWRQQKSIDPIFAIIDKPRVATAAYTEAVDVEFAYEKNGSEREAMDPVERETYQNTFDSLQEATSDADDQMNEASIELVNTPPTSLAGIVALCEYIGPQLDSDAYNLPDEIEWDDGTQSTPAGAFANAIRSAVAAMVSVMSKSDNKSGRDIEAERIKAYSELEEPLCDCVNMGLAAARLASVRPTWQAIHADPLVDGTK